MFCHLCKLCLRIEKITHLNARCSERSPNELLDAPHVELYRQREAKGILKPVTPEAMKSIITWTLRGIDSYLRAFNANKPDRILFTLAEGLWTKKLFQCGIPTRIEPFAVWMTQKPGNRRIGQLPSGSNFFRKPNADGPRNKL